MGPTGMPGTERGSAKWKVSGQAAVPSLQPRSLVSDFHSTNDSNLVFHAFYSNCSSHPNLGCFSPSQTQVLFCSPIRTNFSFKFSQLHLFSTANVHFYYDCSPSRLDVQKSIRLAYIYAAEIQFYQDCFVSKLSHIGERRV